MMTFEDRIREGIKSNEGQLFNIRTEMVKYHSLQDGKLIPDARYANKAQELQRQEQNLMKSISRIEDALARAAEIGSRFKGCNRENPLTWLANKTQSLKRDIGTCQADITSDKRLIESHGDSLVISNRTSNEAWKKELENRIKANEARLQELEAEREKVEKGHQEVEKILQSAS